MAGVFASLRPIRIARHLRPSHVWCGRSMKLTAPAYRLTMSSTRSSTSEPTGSQPAHAPASGEQPRRAGSHILDVFDGESGRGQIVKRTSFAESLYPIAAVLELAQGLADNLEAVRTHQAGHRTPVLADYVHPLH